MKNTSLLEGGTNKLKRNLLEDLDYYLVPSELYKTFEELYGGGPDVVRNVSELITILFILHLYDSFKRFYVHFRSFHAPAIAECTW